MRVKTHLIENPSDQVKKVIGILVKKKLIQAVCFADLILVARCHVNKGNLKKELKKVKV